MSVRKAILQWAPVVCQLGLSGLACGGGGSDPTPPVGTTATTTTLAPGPTPIACATPAPNPLPNPVPDSAFIDSKPTGLCLRSGETGTVEFTNRGNSNALVFSTFSIVDVVNGGQFTISRNTCNALSGRTLFPAAVCVVDVQSSCASQPATARMRADSNARNASSYFVPITCNR
jgi:hypothetical protein